MTTYIVKPGDSLSNIAVAFYGDYTLYTLIQKANNIVNPNLILPGDRLIIPDKPISTTAATSNANPASATAATTKTTTTTVSNNTSSSNTMKYIVGSLALGVLAFLGYRAIKKNKKKKSHRDTES